MRLQGIWERDVRAHTTGTCAPQELGTRTEDNASLRGYRASEGIQGQRAGKLSLPTLHGDLGCMLHREGANGQSQSQKPVFNRRCTEGSQTQGLSLAGLSGVHGAWVHSGLAPSPEMKYNVRYSIVMFEP